MTDPSRTRRVDVRLKRALEARALPRETVVAGPAGTGKTYGILSVLHTLARDYPRLRILFCRQTRASLSESVLATFEDEVLPADGAEALAAGERRDHRGAYRYPNRSRVVLGGLDKPDRVLSTAWDVIFLNEATEAREDAYEKLASRLNRPGRDPRFGFLIADTNPGDPRHWLKRRCDAGRAALWETDHAANPALFDAGGWTPAWGPYRDQLGRLTGTRRQRLFAGLWAAGEGQWFGAFDPAAHAADAAAAEYHPAYPVRLAVDTGVHTGAVWFQVRGAGPGAGGDPVVTVFADYYSYDVPAYENARAILAVTRERCGGRFDVGTCDPSGGARAGFGGVTILSEYERAGLRLRPWPAFAGSVLAGLNLVESFAAVDPPRLLVHPRCAALIDAFAGYRRKKRGGQWVDEPEDPQHPHEDLIDPLRSGLLDHYPEGRRPGPRLARVPARSVF